MSERRTVAIVVQRANGEEFSMVAEPDLQTGGSIILAGGGHNSRITVTDERIMRWEGQRAKELYILAPGDRVMIVKEVGAEEHWDGKV